MVTGCQPIMFWLTARHGTRYPPASQLVRMKDRLPKLQQTIVENHKDQRGNFIQLSKLRYQFELI